MFLGCLLLISLRVITAVEGFWSVESLGNLWQKYMGSCPDRSNLSEHIVNLETRLKNSLIGQHLVQEKLVALVKNHLNGEPQKALVISMHGWTGGGKNYVTQILVESLYENGFGNGNVHLFSGRLHFPLSTKEAVDEYKVNLHNWIRGNVSRCSFATFIFDEIDKMPSGVTDAISPYLDYHSTLSGVDYRNTIFIFISNIGGNIITKRYLELWQSGLPRDKMEYKFFEPDLRKGLYNMEGAFEKSSLLKNHLVSLYLPFLPLEKKHVELCIKREMIHQKILITEKDVQQVLDAMEFFDDRFSVSGCKRVSDMVAMLKYQRRDEL